jgi:hypothetical protein
MSHIDSDVHFLAAAAHAAYDSPEKIAAWAASKGLHSETFHEPQTDTHGFVASKQDLIVLAFRGSASQRNWLTNTRIERKDHVHAGFAEAVEKSWNLAISRLLADPGSRRILVTGHSLGGALALLSARRIGRGVGRLVTYGQPRAVDEIAAADCQEKFGDRYLRVIQDKDAVARVPAFTGGYRHSGGAIRIGGNDMTFPNRVETAEDAVRLITGRAVDVPVAFEVLLPLIQERIERLAGTASSGVQVIGQVGDFLGGLIPSPATAFLHRFDEALNRTARAQSPDGLEAPEIVEDHKMPAYFKALGPPTVSHSE